MYTMLGFAVDCGRDVTAHLALVPQTQDSAVASTPGSPTMEEIARILKKYDEAYIRENFADTASINTFALSFCKDAADIYDAVARVRNVDRNPTGFDLNDAPILGLLVRVWKLLKEVLKYYEQDNAEIISIL